MKDRRWGGEKGETVLREDVVHQPENTLIPTLTRRGRGTVKVFTYRHRDSVVNEAAELAAKLAVVHGAVNARGPQDFSWGPLVCCALGRIRTCNLLIRSSSRIGQGRSYRPLLDSGEAVAYGGGCCGCGTPLLYARW
ncbi:hypothetical protein [Streptomyces sp. CB00072]|uniref:hypothetical protein n=1 Tax=Streptomyces sp. CB00072 TaxID=1703928 RepID=UPI000AD2846D